MTRIEIINKLSALRYCVLWPDRWDDIGFTERPIWVNHEGYGYYFDDEPCRFTTIVGLAPTDVRVIKDKLARGELTYGDIQDTPLVEFFEMDEDNFEDYIPEFANLPDSFDSCIYCGADFDGWSFYSTEEELIQAFSKDSSNYNFGVKWVDMDDNLLQAWHDRLFVESPEFCLPLELNILIQ